jgi:kinesin family protein 15
LYSQKKDYEVALVGAFRREKDKDITLQALTAETQAAVQLVCLKNYLTL